MQGEILSWIVASKENAACAPVGAVVMGREGGLQEVEKVQGR